MTTQTDLIKSSYKILTGEKQLDCFNEIFQLRKKAWPDFIRLGEDLISKIYRIFPNYQMSLFDTVNNKIIGIANSIPILWNKPMDELPDDGLNWILENSDQLNRAPKNNLCAISVTVAPDYRNKGISAILLNQLKILCQNQQLKNLIVPVRPVLKKNYPLIPIEDYIQWKDKKGFLFDPWLNKHISLGAKIAKICKHSTQVTASIKQWEEWTGLIFPGDGFYIIKEALNPLKIDYTHNQGLYIEPNIWVYYPILH